MVNIYKGSGIKKITIEKPNISIENLFKTYQNTSTPLSTLKITRKNNNDNELDLSMFSSTENNNHTYYSHPKNIYDYSKDAGVHEYINQQLNIVKDNFKADKTANGHLVYYEINNDGYTPQGLTQNGEKTFISAYKKKNLAKIYIYDTATGNYEGNITLNNKAHVGGIGFDKTNNILYITNSKGIVNAYNYSEIQQAIKNHKNYFPNSLEYNVIITDDYQSNTPDSINISTSVILEGLLSVKENTDKGNASSLYFYNDRVYIGTFDGDSKGEMVSYKVVYDENKNTINIDESATEYFKIPKNTQGIAVTEYNSKKYLVTTQSIGQTDSSITVFEIDSTGNLKELGIKYYNDPGIEGLHIDEEGNIRAVFEKPKIPLIGEVGDREHSLDTTMEQLLNSLGEHKFLKDTESSITGWLDEIF